MERVVHPGPARPSRCDVASCAGAEAEITLAPGIPLDRALADGLGGHEYACAYIDLKDALCAPLVFVGPDHDPEGKKAGWYSAETVFEQGRIAHLGIIVGEKDGEMSLHGHGIWGQGLVGGTDTMGHILPDKSFLATATTAKAVLLDAARFDRRHDSETGFDIFHVDPEQGGENAAHSFAAMRIAPNEDLTLTTMRACNNLGWDAARAFGIGSLNGARFAAGENLAPQPTEFLITGGSVRGDDCALDITLIGVGGTSPLSGRPVRGENPVLITAEMILQRESI